MTAKVVMYSKTTCPYCHRAERVLRPAVSLADDLGDDLTQLVP